MPDTLQTITVPSLVTPEIVPGGTLLSPQEEMFRNQLQDIINNYGDTINLLIQTVDNSLSVTIGSGGVDATWQVITQSDYGSGGVGDTPTSSTQLVAGAVCLVVTQDLQIVAGTWHNAGGGANNYVIQLLKAIYPYNQWTNLAGDSRTPTTLTWAGSSINNGNPTIVQGEDESLHVGFYNSDAGVLAPQEAVYLFNGTGWTYSTTTTLATTFTFASVNEGEIIQAADGALLWARRGTRGGPVHSVHIFRKTSGSWGTDPVATYTAYYDPTGPSCLSLGTSQGEDARLVQIDDDRVVAFWMWQGNSTDNRYTLLWTMSTDGGITWPADSCSGTNYTIGYPDSATGSIFPIDGGTPPVPEANLRISGFGGKVFGRFWDVAAIPGTSRIAIVVWGDDGAGVVHSQLPGIRYLEFDAEENGGLGGTTDVSDWVAVNYQVPITGLMLSVSDGVTRVLWGQGIETTLNDGAVSLCYSRVVDGGSALEATDWTNPKEVYRFANQDSSVLQYNQFTAPVSGVFTMQNGEKVWPVLFARGSMGAGNIGAATEQALLMLLRTVNLDRV